MLRFRPIKVSELFFINLHFIYFYFAKHTCKFQNIFLFSGIEYLCENHQLQMNAKDIAHFLYKGEGLNKTAIGECCVNKYLFTSKSGFRFT